jgi:2-polyprenyl-3-methyl-5-hydroxy-6-metoxy-1,4-benzoquinol methylase
MVETQEEYVSLLNSISNTGLWYIDTLIYSDDNLEISGWAKAPNGIRSDVTFLVNEKEFDDITYPLLREDVGRVFNFDPDSSLCGFVCKTSLKPFNINSDDGIILKFINKRTRRPFYDISPKYYFFSKKQIYNGVPIPDGQRRIRVHGSDIEFTFLLTGYQIFMNCKLALKNIFKRDFDSFNNILDWGCGSGRMCRYFHNLKQASFTGVDIDQDNINWCTKNFNFGRYSTIPLYPPTKLKSSEYDLIIGISVFTHLDESAQFAWLKELNRIASDEAVLLMSVHGDTAWCHSRADYYTYLKLEQDGYLDIGHDSILDEVINQKDYYRAVWHTHAYIREKWSKYFKIIEILPGYINNHQDLVVMQKK